MSAISSAFSLIFFFETNKMTTRVTFLSTATGVRVCLSRFGASLRMVEKLNSKVIRAI